MFYGALKPKIDKRDFSLRAGVGEYPASFQCKNLMPVKNQSSVNSCVAHATSSILEALNKAETNEFVSLSTNFIYGMQGVAYGRKDQGMYLRDACKIAKNYGDTTETTIPGNTEQPKCTEDLRKQLTDAVYKEACIFHINSFARCDSESAIKHALMNYGPVLVSIKWYDKYTTRTKTGQIHFDKSSSFGYHAIMVYGWNEVGWLCQNSWGRNWNGNGRFIYPYSEKFEEAWSFVDAKNDANIVVPKNNKLFDIFYKLINFITNFIQDYFKGRE